MKYIFLLFLNLMSVNQAISHVTSIIELHKVNEYGSQGTTFYSIAELEKSEFRDIYPKVANAPENWRDIQEYYYVLNEQQLLFQSYVAGKLDKKELSDQFEKRKYLLQDTLGLSRCEIITGISYIIGKEKDSDTYYYIIDRNNNNDFGDDVIKKLNSQNNLFGSNIIGKKIRYQYYNENKSQEDEILMSLSISNVTWPTLDLQKSSIKSTEFNLHKDPTSFLLNRDHIVEKMNLRSDGLRSFLANKSL